MGIDCNISRLEVRFWHSPAYLSSNSVSVDDLDGLIYQSYKSILSSCCVNAINSTYVKYANEDSILHSDKLEESVAMPIFTLLPSAGGWPQNFLPIITLNAFVFVAKPIATSSNLNTILLALWPILVCFVGLCALFGYLIWFSETYLQKDKSDLPVTFGAGMVDSFWYAFVTASTVGYGDKVSKSILGKCITIVWSIIAWVLLTILVGTFSSLYNFAGNTAMNMPPVGGSNIGVLRGSAAGEVVEFAGGKVHSSSTISSLINDLVAGNTDAILLDTLAFVQDFGYSSDIWTTYNLRMEIYLHYQLTAGILFLNSYSTGVPAAAFNCFATRSFVLHNQNESKQKSVVSNLTASYDATIAKATSSQVFSDDHVIFSVTIVGSTLLLIVVTQAICWLRRRCDGNLKADFPSASPSRTPSENAAARKIEGDCSIISLSSRQSLP